MSLKFSFDYLNNYEKPIITLCNPQRNPVGIIGQTKDLTYTAIFNGLSGLTFQVAIDNPYYDEIAKNRLIQLEDIAWFVIDETTVDDDGGACYKTVHCYSYEYTLNNQNIDLADGTYKFYDPITPEDTILGKIIATIPLWSIGTVSSDLWLLYRTFEVNEEPIYSFLMGDLSDAYNCIVDFDTNTRTINFYTKDDATTKTNIMLSLNNLIKDINIQTSTDEIITALSIIGDDTLDSSLVNPMGTNIAYNFDFFMTTEWMTRSLIDALTIWKDKFNTHQSTYADLLSDLKTYNTELIVYNSELVDLQSSYTALETLRTEYIVQGVTNLSDITNQINSNLTQQTNKKSQISSKTNQIASVQSQLQEINTSLQFVNNFTTEQLEELSCFINTGTFQNENFGVLSSMTAVEEQELAQQLYDQGVAKLEELSQPNYTFDASVLNYPFLKEFEYFTSQTELGSIINLEIEPDVWIEPVLLEMVIPYDDPNSFSMTFSNKMRLNSAVWTLSELQNSSVTASNKVYVSGLKWNEASTKANAASEYINNALDLVNQEIQSTENLETVINQFGIWNRQLLDDGTFNPEQMRLTHNLMAFTKDNWQTVSTAFGRVPDPFGNGYAYGLVGDVIIGTILAGNQLLITNENGYVNIDGERATFYNCVIELLRSDNKSKILLDPNNGIKIQTNKTGTFKDVFYVDTNGYLMATDITATGGTIGGFNITESRFYSSVQSNGSPVIDLNTDGTGRISGFSWTATESFFDGGINAPWGNIGEFIIDSSSIRSTNDKLILGYNGHITVESATIGGLAVTASTLGSTNNNIKFNQNGSGQCGLMTWDNSTTTFSGDIVWAEGSITSTNPGTTEIESSRRIDISTSHLYLNSEAIVKYGLDCASLSVNGYSYSRKTIKDGDGNSVVVLAGSS